MVSEVEVLREQLKRREKEIESLKKERDALLGSALKQSRENRELSEEMKKLVEINKDLVEKAESKK